ncbi:KAP family P-loop NTPase fold protein [Streptomyces rubiginosohelvolus]
MSEQRTYFRDDPDPSHDLLERRQFAARTVQALSEVRRQSKSSVAGLIAPWGAGKSTTLAMVVEGLKENEGTPWIVVEMNPWLYSDSDSLQLGFFVALREALPADAKWNNTRERIGNFFTAISPAGKVNGLAGVDASSALEAVGRWVAGDVSANALKEKSEETLKDLDQPILFVMDDLDRLTPDELLMVFKLVRLVGRLPNVYYLLSYDEKTLLDLIQQTNIAAGNRARARDYMEKIIQVRFDVPAIRPRQQAELINAAMSEIMDRYAVDPSEEDNQLFAHLYRKHLRSTLTTPRAINRYFAQVDALYETLHEEVNFIEFTLITFLRTFEPDVYKNLTGSWRSELLGEHDSYLSTRNESDGQHRERWREMLLGSHVSESDVPGVYAILLSLFHRVRPADGYGGRQQGNPLRRGVGNRDYFDRYFNFGVPGDDVPDAALRHLIHILDESPDAESVETIRSALRNNTSRVCRKLIQILPGHSNACAELLPALTDVYAHSEHAIFSVDGSPLVNVEATAAVALSELTTQQVSASIEEMDSYTHGALLASNALLHLRDQTPANLPALRENVSRILERRVAFLMERELSAISTHDYRHVYHWRVTAGKDAVDPKLKDALIEGPWSALDFAGRSISLATSGEVSSLSDLDFEFLEDVAGIEYFFDALTEEIEGAGGQILRHHYSDTMENRRTLALSFLKFRRDSIRGASEDS